MAVKKGEEGRPAIFSITNQSLHMGACAGPKSQIQCICAKNEHAAVKSVAF